MKENRRTAGKTTLLRILAGLSAAEETVRVRGRSVVPPEDRNLAMVFQDLALWPHLTARGNLHSR